MGRKSKISIHSLNRIPVVKDNDDNRTDDSPEIENIKSHRCNLTKYVIPIYHKNLF